VSIFLANVKEHTPLSASASVDQGVGFVITGKHLKRAADRGCVTRLVRRFLVEPPRNGVPWIPQQEAIGQAQT
jgi:hypothetical protein